VNLGVCRIVLRPRGPLESLDLGVRLSRAWWRPTATLAAVGLLPAWVACTALAWAVGWHWAAALAPLALGPLLQPPFTLLFGRLLFTEDVSAGALRAALRERASSWALATGLGWGGALVAALSCGTLSAPLALGLLYVQECAILERVAADRAVRRSLRLSGGHTAHAVAGGLGSWLLTAWIAATLEVSGQAVLGPILQTEWVLPNLWAAQCGPLLLAGLLASHPVWALWRLLLYVDVRTRVEGWDLQVGLRAAGLER
jgi:hypothetical protein